MHKFITAVPAVQSLSKIIYFLSLTVTFSYCTQRLSPTSVQRHVTTATAPNDHRLIGAKRLFWPIRLRTRSKAKESSLADLADVDLTLWKLKSAAENIHRRSCVLHMLLEQSLTATESR